MTRRTLLFSAALGPFLPAAPAAQAPATLALTSVSVIDAAGPRPNQTVIVQGDRILTVGNTAEVPVPRTTRRLACPGKFLIPGLWDMHVHLSVARPGALPLLVANGVLGVRDMGGSLNEIDAWQAAIRGRIMAGPRIFRAGPMLNGKSFNEFQIAVENASEAKGAVRALHNSGVDFIKVHAAIGRDAYFGVADECRKLGMTFAGHLPRVITPEEASDAGQGTLEHLGTLFDGTAAAGLAPEQLRETILRFRDQGAPELFARFARNGTYFTPTLAIERASLHLTAPPPSPHDKYIATQARKLTREMLAKYKDVFTPEFIATQHRQLDATVPLVRVLHESGALLLTGTDTGSSLLAPGFSLHEELAMLADAGVPPLDVLKAATSNPAKLFKLEDRGTVQQGKLADLVLLNASPLENIRNTQKISAVVCRGELLERPALDALLRQSETEAQRR
jgi:imidazolonepropionase-like amidohydrolase